MTQATRGACLELGVVDDRSRKTIVDQIIVGLVHGSLLGGGLVIQSRDAERIRFEGRRFGSTTANRGEIELSRTEGAKTSISCRLWCQGLRWRIALKSALIGALAATIALLAFGWLIVVSVPVAIAIAVAVDVVGWRRARAALKHDFETFFSNSRYLDPL